MSHWIIQNGRVNSYVLFSALLSTGILSGIVMKFQQRCIVDGIRFNHPFMQTLLMFIGEMFCYFCVSIYRCFWKSRFNKDREKEQEQGKKLKLNKFLLVIPSLLDFVGSSVTLVAMSMMPFSVYYMMRGGGVIITAILSVLCLKTELERQNYVGLLLNFIGFLIVGISAVLYSPTDQDTTYLIFGIMLIIVSLFIASTQFVFDEYIFMKYSINPFEEIGWEGIWGVLINGFALIAFVQIPCPSFISDCPDGKLESVTLFFESISTMKGDDQPALIYLVIFSIFVLMLMNGISACIIKYHGALNKTMVSAVSPFVVWIITIWLKWDVFNFGQFTGYSVITLGTLLYTEVLVLPFWGLNKKLIMKKQIQSKNLKVKVKNDNKQKINNKEENKQTQQIDKSLKVDATQIIQSSQTPPQNALPTSNNHKNEQCVINIENAPYQISKIQ
ncbi:UAA transporter family protein (macronuclear) [Tetrahymena thermophila SB210]|uniref:UAA transporter family protein n=1 Tax=Tetrahymena thermophila (strain SB210) TaxID=312017 RepID=Q23NJ2_TETTS|nr:UAA transporter family protein [Tetrahymena thermophila SB210]EAR98082.2 UAA transporter family protein [Tetrahymena thermophila SB210]|eukprot:XP_001018327.2 UAA transporter family protein [Tetrahymena thermophila SB210]